MCKRRTEWRFGNIAHALPNFPDQPAIHLAKRLSGRRSSDARLRTIGQVHVHPDRMSGSLPASSPSLSPQPSPNCNLSRQAVRNPLRLCSKSRHSAASIRIERSSSSCRACLGSEDAARREDTNSTRAYSSDPESSGRLPTQGEALVRGIGGDDDSRGVQLMERSKPPADIDYLAVHPVALLLSSVSLHTGTLCC